MAVPEGSFWKAFVHPQSPIDEILEKENFKLEELLEHDDIIQECKYLNSGLIEYLSRPETVEKLIRYVIQPAPLISLEDDQKQEPQPARYPYVSSELFACEVISMLDTLFEHPHLLALFFTFLSQKPPLDPSSAGYFRKVVVILIQRKFEQLVKFIQANNILDAMVNHIGLYSIMELLIMVGWDDSLGQVNDSKWLYEQNLVPKLVAKLDPTYEKEEDVQVNAARALVDVVVKCAPTSDSLLIRHLQHPSVLDKLFRYMFSGSRGSLTNSLSIVIVLVQREANRRNEIPPTGDPQGTESKDSVTGLPEIIAHVLKHLPELSNLLKENQDLRKALPTQFGALSPPLGETRMKAVELFLVLFRSNYPEVNKELAALNVISYIIDLFFKFEWNNMLHGLVESIIRTILDTDSLILKQSCFIQGRLVDRVLEAYAKNAEAVKARKGCRLGYMGHVVRLCGAIAYVLDRDVKLKQQLLLDQVKEWDAFVAGPLHQDNESHNAVLAGGAPTFPPEPEEQQAAYAPATYSTEASRAPISSGQKDDDDDNDPFAFNDGDDTFNSSSTYGLPREEEEWNHENSATNQFQTDWPDLYHTRDSSGVEEHSDSSDEEPQPNFAPTDTGAGSSDDDDDDFHSRTGKTKKKTARHGVGSSPGGAESGVETVKEDGKSDASPVKATGSGSTPSTTSTTTPATTTTTTAPAGKGTGDEWAAFED